MKRIGVIIIGCLSVFCAQAQVFNTNHACVKFNAAKTAVEPIKAENAQAKLILNEANGEVACLLEITQFSFPNKLMQEHFNENYLESDTYPKATLSGKIKDFTTTDFATEQKVTVEGDFTIHGKKVRKSVPITLIKKGDTYFLKGSFTLELKEFKIKIPKLMFYKITEDVNVTLTAELNKS